MRVTRRAWLRQVGSAVAAAATLPRLVCSGSYPRLTAEHIGTNLPFLGISLTDALKEVRRLGFQTVELMASGSPVARPGRQPGFEFGKLSEAQKQTIKDALQEFKHVSVHLPFGGIYVASSDPAEQERGRAIMEDSLRGAAYFGVETANIHLIPPRGKKLADCWDELVRLYRRWGDMAQEGGFVLAVETGYPTSVRDFLRFIEEVDHPSVGGSIDVGHEIWYEEFRSRYGEKIPNTPEAYKHYNDVIESIIDGLGDKLFHFHVHDIDPAVWKEHKPLKYGVVDYPRLFRKLLKIGYNRLLIFEISDSQETIRESLREAKAKLEKALAEASGSVK